MEILHQLTPLDDLLGKFSLTKTLRIVAWAVRFVQNACLRDWSKSTGGGGVGRSRRGVGHHLFSLSNGVDHAILNLEL